jgi:hypothetical protein
MCLCMCIGHMYRAYQLDNYFSHIIMKEQELVPACHGSATENMACQLCFEFFSGFSTAVSEFAKPFFNGYV